MGGGGREEGGTCLKTAYLQLILVFIQNIRLRYVRKNTHVETQLLQEHIVIHTLLDLKLA